MWYLQQYPLRIIGIFFSWKLKEIGRIQHVYSESQLGVKGIIVNLTFNYIFYTFCRRYLLIYKNVPTHMDDFALKLSNYTSLNRLKYVSNES